MEKEENKCSITIESNGVKVLVTLDFPDDGGIKASVKFPDDAVSKQNKAMIVGAWIFQQLTGA